MKLLVAILIWIIVNKLLNALYFFYNNYYCDQVDQKYRDLGYVKQEFSTDDLLQRLDKDSRIYKFLEYMYKKRTFSLRHPMHSRYNCYIWKSELCTINRMTTHYTWFFGGIHTSSPVWWSYFKSATILWLPDLDNTNTIYKRLINKDYIRMYLSEELKTPFQTCCRKYIEFFMRHVNVEKNGIQITLSYRRPMVPYFEILVDGYVTHTVKTFCESSGGQE